MRYYHFAVAVALAFIGAMLVGCPTVDPVEAEAEKAARAQQEMRLSRLEIQYHILEKDNPTPEETQGFRADITEARDEIEKRDYTKAGEYLTNAEKWMEEARPRLYQRHFENIKSGKSKERGTDLIKQAKVYQARGDEAARDLDNWTRDQYYDAAVEQATLALAAEMTSPDRIFDFLDIYPSVEQIYKECGHTEEAGKLREAMIEYVSTVIDAVGKEIRSRLNGTAQYYDPMTLRAIKGADRQVPDAFKLLDEDLNRVNDFYKKFSAKAQQIFPETNFDIQDFDPYINRWEHNWMSYYMSDTPPPPPEDPKENECIAKVRAHSAEYQAGAISAEQAKIQVQEFDHYNQGQVMILKVKVQNLNTTPIYNVKVTVVGGVMSDVIDLGFFKMGPGVGTTIQVPLQCYTTEAFAQGGMPNYKVVVLYKEQSDGPEKRAIQGMARPPK